MVSLYSNGTLRQRHMHMACVHAHKYTYMPTEGQNSVSVIIRHRFFCSSHYSRTTMEGANLSGVSEFLLLGLSQDPRQQQLLFSAFLSMYLLTGLGNLLIILAIVSDPKLHTPMYLFLSNLSFSDICFTSTTVPKMLVNIQTQSKAITYADCISQMSVFLVFAELDNFLLAVMAYDRYIAICHPLRYSSILTGMLCAQMVALCHVLSHLHALLHTFLMGRLIFCADNRIPHFFCDLSPLLKLACSDTSLNDIMVYTVGALPIITPFVGILTSYTRIFTAVLRIPSTGGKWKAFSTCGSHLTVVTVYYVPCIFIYLRAGSKSPFDGAVAVFYTVVTPLLNPLIYTLRNQEVKLALRRMVGSQSTKSEV